MDSSKAPGIKFERVFLSRLNFELPVVEPDKFQYDVKLESKQKIDGKTLIYALMVKLYDRFEFEMTGIFTAIEGAENLTLEKFAAVNAPALLMPFAREVISSITSRTPLPHLLLPPINILALSKKSTPKEVPEK